ncbi:MAG: PDZ domain-containing protein, partial [Pseudomonadota bacterium]
GAVIETARDLTRAVAETDAGETVEIEILRSGRKIDLLVQIAELASAEGVPADERGLSARTGGELGLALETTDAGVVIRTIRPGSPAEQAGLAEGDRLLAVNQAEILSSDDVLSALDQAKAADRTAILLHFERGKRNRFVALPLAPT